MFVLIGHELRTPLSTARAHVELLREYGEYDAYALDIILAKLEEIDRLIGDLLFMTRLESGRLRLQFRRIDLADLVRSAAHQARALAPDHSIRVDTPDRPVEGQWDFHRLSQVLQNLLGNAVKYSPGGGDIEVRLDDLGQEIRVSVTDHGEGIAPEDLPRLFAPFYRGLDAAARVRGMGVGLYLSRLLVEAHGGRIWAVSAGKGHGSTFVVALPRA